MMTVLGGLIKTTIALSDKIQNDHTPHEMQADVLKHLLLTAKDTAFGKFYGFDQLLESEHLEDLFAQQIPIHTYDQLHERWWVQLEKGIPDITWPGINPYFARSAGTTSSQKRIPVTEDMLESIRKVGIQQVLTLRKYDLPPEFFERQVLMLGSCTTLHQNGDFLEGEISGITASRLPFWFKKFYRPGIEISGIEDWQERILEIAKAAKHWDICAISGIPSWVELMLKKIIDYHQVNHIHDIWPNLMVYTPGGISFEPHKKNFELLMGKPMIYMDTYLASEGFLGFQSYPLSSSMELVLDQGVYFEFVEFNEDNLLADGTISPHVQVLRIDQVKEHQPYILVISTVAGAWRYVIGDTIEFDNVKTVSFKITGRTASFLNVVGSQLSVYHLDQMVTLLQKQFDINIPEYTVAAVPYQGKYFHQWYLGVKEHKVNEEEMAEFIDTHLQDTHKNFRGARSKALYGVRVKSLPVQAFFEYQQTNQKMGGQVKFIRVLKAKDVQQWEDFLITQNLMA
jgi:hypothetical protein